VIIRDVCGSLVLRTPSAEVRERTVRLEREARILASLNHPNIAQIYEFEMSGDLRALIMELARQILKQLRDRTEREFVSPYHPRLCARRPR
jgi:serine/threonine protein kinase